MHIFTKLSHHNTVCMLSRGTLPEQGWYVRRLFGLKIIFSVITAQRTFEFNIKIIVLREKKNPCIFCSILFDFYVKKTQTLNILKAIIHDRIRKLQCPGNIRIVKAGIMLFSLFFIICEEKTLYKDEYPAGGGSYALCKYCHLIFFLLKQ